MGGEEESREEVRQRSQHRAAATRAVAADRQKKGARTCSDPPCILYIQTIQQDCSTRRVIRRFHMWLYLPARRWVERRRAERRLDSAHNTGLQPREQSQPIGRRRAHAPEATRRANVAGSHRVVAVTVSIPFSSHTLHTTRTPSVTCLAIWTSVTIWATTEIISGSSSCTITGAVCLHTQ